MSSIKVKQLDWKTANSPKTLREMGFDKPKYRKENQRLADLLTKNGYEFWDTCCIADYENYFCGYTITFCKKVGNVNVWFKWRWVEETSVYWQGTMIVALDTDPTYKWMHPYYNAEINYITAESIHLLSTYENFLVRSHEAVSPWVSLAKLPEVKV